MSSALSANFDYHSESKPGLYSTLGIGGYLFQSGFIQKNMTQKNVLRFHISIPSATHTEEIQPAGEKDYPVEARG